VAESAQKHQKGLTKISELNCSRLSAFVYVSGRVMIMSAEKNLSAVLKGIGFTRDLSAQMFALNGN
jgi:hypothetical protein